MCLVWISSRAFHTVYCAASLYIADEAALTLVTPIATHLIILLRSCNEEKELFGIQVCASGVQAGKDIDL